MKEEIICFLLLFSTAVMGQNNLKIETEAAFTFSHFEQQVKTKIGGEKGEKISDNSELGSMLACRVQIKKWISAGLFIQYDLGSRHLAEFDSFNLSGATVVKNKISGHYNELWAGPLFRFHHKTAFVELGYGLIGIRNDDLRYDVFNSKGQNQGNFKVNSLVAWHIGLGMKTELTDKVSLLLKAQYRVRYYDSRGGEVLQNDIRLGSQNINPFIGLIYKIQ